jgi:hypothetical protein
MNAKLNNEGWSEVSNFETLQNLDHQPMGPRHMPIPHYTAIEFFKERLAEHGIQVIAEHAIMSPDTYKLMYVADVAPIDGIVNEDFCYSVGFLNNNDRSRAFTGIAGTRVHMNNAGMYVCEGAFKTRHMQNVFNYLTERSANIIQWFKDYHAQQSGRVAKMKATPCTDEILGSVLLQYIRKPYTLSSTNIKLIVKEFDNPKYEAFKDRTLWSLQNTTAEVFRRVKSPLFRLEAMEVFNEAIDNYLK